MDQPVLVLDGTALTCAEVAAVARGQAQVALSRPGRDRAAAAAEVVRRVSAQGEGYGRTTGVGSNRDVTLAGGGHPRAAAAAEVVRRVSAQGEVYGRTTGVGSNRDVTVAGGDIAGHGLRLLRSHAGGAGELISPDLGRAMLTVRVNQIAAGGSGIDPGVLDVLVECISRGLSVPAAMYGAIGTG